MINFWICLYMIGRRASVVGWGKYFSRKIDKNHLLDFFYLFSIQSHYDYSFSGTTYYGGKESTIQRKAELPIWRNEDCNY